MKCCLECKGKRHPGCHSTCETYITEKASDEARKEKIRKAKAEDVLADNTIVKLSEARRRKYA